MDKIGINTNKWPSGRGGDTCSNVSSTCQLLKFWQNSPCRIGPCHMLQSNIHPANAWSLMQTSLLYTSLLTPEERAGGDAVQLQLPGSGPSQNIFILLAAAWQRLHSLHLVQESHSPLWQRGGPGAATQCNAGSCLCVCEWTAPLHTLMHVRAISYACRY